MQDVCKVRPELLAALLHHDELDDLLEVILGQKVKLLDGPHEDFDLVLGQDGRAEKQGRYLCELSYVAFATDDLREVHLVLEGGLVEVLENKNCWKTNFIIRVQQIYL